MNITCKDNKISIENINNSNNDNNMTIIKNVNEPQNVPEIIDESSINNITSVNK